MSLLNDLLQGKGNMPHDNMSGGVLKIVFHNTCMCQQVQQTLLSSAVSNTITDQEPCLIEHIYLEDLSTIISLHTLHLNTIYKMCVCVYVMSVCARVHGVYVP